MDHEARAAATAFADEQDPDGRAARAESVERALAEYAAHGYCSSYGEWRPDVNGIATPVFSLGGRRVYGLNVGGPSFHVKRRQLETVYAKRLKQAAEVLSLRA